MEYMSSRLAVGLSSMVIVIALAGAAACNDVSEGGTVPDGGGTTAANPAAEKACLDTADAVARAAVRCGCTAPDAGKSNCDYQTNYDAFIKTASGGSCKNIRRVRDEASLRNKCIPSLGTVSCADFLANRIDATCIDQLDTSTDGGK
jgi:hypothetical protein